MRAKEYLQQVRKLNSMIRNKLSEREQWQAVAYGITSPSMGERVQSSSNPHKMQNAIINGLDVEQEINQCIIELQRKKQEIIATIEQLPEVEYDLLHRVYIQEMTLDEVAYERQRSKSWIATIHGLALKHLQELLDTEQN
jgi:DNA-directed RNA polymerase specialized sigma subunit